MEGKDLLRCETCEALLAYPSCENIRDDVEAMEGVEREMIDALATTHERGCAWRETACSTSARMFPANEPTTTPSERQSGGRSQSGSRGTRDCSGGCGSGVRPATRTREESDLISLGLEPLHENSFQ